MLDAANTLNHTTRAKRMTILPDPSHGPIDHRHHCPIESMIGVERRGLPFSCQTRQVPLLVFVGLLGFISSCILGCCFRKLLKALCCCCFCNYAEAKKDSRKSKNVENIPSPQPSSNRDVVMIKIQSQCLVRITLQTAICSYYQNLKSLFTKQYFINDKKYQRKIITLNIIQIVHITQFFKSMQ